jgi:alanyl aminopeptidase
MRILVVMLLAALLTTPAHAAGPTPGYLGRDVAPTLEVIHLKLDPDSARYHGWVRVSLDVARTTREVKLYADGQTFDHVSLTQQGRAIPVQVQKGTVRGLVTLVAERPLAKGPAMLVIAFTNDFNTQAVGLYRVVRDGTGYLFTQFEADDARNAFPCWDEPAYKIPWQLTLEVPEKQQALSNVPITKTAANGRWKTLTFERTPPLPSYLLAVAVGPLEFVDVPGMKVPTRIVTVRGQAHLAQVAAQAVPPVVAALERYFGMPYPFRKLDLIATPDFWYGAMENAGAIVFAENALLLDTQTSSPAQRERITRIIAHELAHMWFGDYVTMAWWDDLWLNESFADWMADKITDQVKPQMQVPLTTIASVQDIMEADARPSTEPIRHVAATGDDAMHTVGVSYNKGKGVLGMFERWIGEEAFRKGVNQYLKAHAWGNATHDDLWASFGASSGKDVAGAMTGFIEQNGVPLVTVEPLPDGQVRIGQSRFLNVGVEAEARRWRIPVALRWSDGKSERTLSLLLVAADTTVKLEGGGKSVWIMPNADGLGYYRWRIPPDMLLALAKHADAMTPGERIAFLGNLNALLDSGALRGDDYLRMLANVANDPEPLVASTVISGMSRAEAAFVPDAVRDHYAAYVRGALKPVATRYGLEPRKGEKESVSLLRPRLFEYLGDEGRDRETLLLADQLVERYRKDPGAVDAGIASTALDLHAIHGDRVLFESYRQAFESSKAPADRRNYLSALGHFEDPGMQDVALRYAIEGPLRASETFTIAGGVGGQSDRGADRALRWALENYDHIKSHVPPEFLTRMVGFGSGCDSTRLEKVRMFFADADHRVPGIERSMARTTDAVKDCVGLRGREGAAVETYLRKVAAGADARP